MENIKTELDLAIYNQQWEEVRDLLGGHQEFLEQNVILGNHDFLQHAICNEAPEDIIAQMSSFCNINMQQKLKRKGKPKKNDDCNSALHVALKRKRWDLVPVLLQHGADVNLVDGCDETSLHLAARHGAPADIIPQLISPSNIHMENEDDRTVLHVAVMKERWDLVPVLLQHGADINSGDDVNATPLYWAIDGDDAPADIITQLISPHNINMQDVDGITALHGAVFGKRWHLVPVLLQHGADINLSDDDNATPLYRAACEGAPADIITQLISPQNINMQKQRNGNTALHGAVRGKRWELVPVLLQYGADPFMLDSAQLDQPLVRSLKALCISTIRSHMPVKSDEAYEGLGLPEKLVAEVKLRPQAEDIVKRGSE